jgi:hypothetical protein
VIFYARAISQLSLIPWGCLRMIEVSSRPKLILRLCLSRDRMPELLSLLRVIGHVPTRTGFEEAGDGRGIATLECSRVNEPSARSILEWLKALEGVDFVLHNWS